LIRLGVDNPNFDVVGLGVPDNRRKHKRRGENKVEKSAKFGR
jgi:hypothetical protein